MSLGILLLWQTYLTRDCKLQENFFPSQ